MFRTLLLLQVATAEYCNHRQATNFNTLVTSGEYAACDDAQKENGILWHEKNIDLHGPRKLFEMSCEIDLCQQVYEKLVAENLAPDCEIEIGQETLNIQRLIQDTHDHCVRSRRRRIDPMNSAVVK